MYIYILVNHDNDKKSLVSITKKMKLFAVAACDSIGW